MTADSRARAAAACYCLAVIAVAVVAAAADVTVPSSTAGEDFDELSPLPIGKFWKLTAINFPRQKKVWRNNVF